ncbi:hypothetical protein M9H77_20729 [Catharanthus roseus]|uniref:Uncharacterized protein n=1 Tax=Catharanthus roseus TaxID=4058 RepID=A0ACC0AL08_CATRO|nr:hypothetical protein M9H77_20729 [Catharanthus roseus]
MKLPAIYHFSQYCLLVKCFTGTNHTNRIEHKKDTYIDRQGESPAIVEELFQPATSFHLNPSNRRSGSAGQSGSPWKGWRRKEKREKEEGAVVVKEKRRRREGEERVIRQQGGEEKNGEREEGNKERRRRERRR